MKPEARWEVEGGLGLTAREIYAASEARSDAYRALQRLFEPDKINVGALGNMVPQLHIHVVARRRGDGAWPGPVWGQGVAVSYAPAALADTRGRLVEALTVSGTGTGPARDP